MNEALESQTQRTQPHVIIVGGGFGGLAAARALKKAPVRVILLDRMNHHLFQPLLYQVATAGLAPSEIASPIREVLRKQRNATVGLLEVTRVDADARQVFFSYLDGAERSIPYDYLILATGVQQSYFGHDEFASFAPGLKSLHGCGGDSGQVAEGLRDRGDRGRPRTASRPTHLRAGRRGADRRGDGGGDRRDGTGDAQVRLPTG